ncbi:sensor histidine kinase [Paenibacillus ehimensis]|uniref:histidine kinase n=1 Tax=Paenibacillus ehimensis TaxID=79264 RepID=A0ABT8VBC8_9BACL|nr:ATP-binding protein [Paenibacillus ehimensis]MDO3678293.1 ATP-binding protein [Paenibacillus ehimensis]MEC0210339.1 ATP-binding protein [Paenibacillus ehimensis]
MKRGGVTFKLFAITASFFMLFYAIVLLGQLLFFERFYQNQRLDGLAKKLQSFSEQYASNRWDEPRITREMGLFISQNKAQLAILNPEGKVKYDNFFRIVIRDDKGASVKISLMLMPDSDQKELLAAHLQRGDRIEVEGVYEDPAKDLIFPVVIRKAGMKDIGSVETSGIEGQLEQVSGVITDALLPSPNLWNLRQGLMYLAIDEWFPLTEEQKAVLQNGRMIEREWTETLTGVRSFIAIQPVMREGKVSELIFAVMSLQQISEAYDALRLFYLYIGVGGIVLILLLSLIFSKFVTKPLLTLNKIALRMAKLDFSAKSPIRSNDEFGSLSYSLNSLSETLDHTLKELHQANEQLRADMEQKQRMEQRQKEFVSNASHELKTPLSIVKGFAEGLRDGISESKRERYLEVILDETGKMEDLVKDMLELTKLESKTIKLKKSRFMVSELIEDIVDKLSHHLNEKGLRVVHMAAGEHPVYADQSKIEQVLFNILINAIRHAVPGSEITVRIESDGERIRVAIDNEGENIPEDQLDDIWERFYRAERSRNRKTGGTGLGLAIVKHILELHESRYGVTNTEKGVSFYFML